MSDKRPPTEPLRCGSCRRGWALLRIDSKLLRCAACGHQNGVDEATRMAKEEADRRNKVWEGPRV